MRKLNLWGCVFLLSIFCCFYGCYGEGEQDTEDTPSGSEIVSTQYGLVEGMVENDVFVFKGIPYAKPPVGDLRFHSPMEPEPWEGILSAQEFGPICAQMKLADIVVDMMLNDYEEECEDCLYLNIWTPSPDDEKRPVMFWIHGGADFYGSGSQPFYYGDMLAAAGDVVVVTFNYRMGVFGNLTHPDLEDENGYIGNWGLLDMIAALKWVKENIEAFGGDPDNVTIFGESAGGWAVCSLMISPETKIDDTRLYKRAIAESPAIKMRTLNEAVADSENIFTKTRCAGGDFNCLRNLSFDEIRLADGMIMEIVSPILKPLLNKNTQLRRFLDWNVLPVIDGKVIPKTATEAITAGETADIQMIIGTCEEEADILGYIMGALLPRDIILQYISAIVPGEMPDGTSKAEVIYDTYLQALIDADVKMPKIKVFGNILSDYIFRIQSIKFAEMHKAAGGDAYMYQMRYPLILDQTIHVTEVPFVFGSLKMPGPLGLIINFNDDPAAVALRDAFQDAWTSFARIGVPDINTEEITLTWPQYDGTDRKTMIFGEDGAFVMNAPEESERAVWDEVEAEFYAF